MIPYTSVLERSCSVHGEDEYRHGGRNVIQNWDYGVERAIQNCKLMCELGDL